MCCFSSQLSAQKTVKGILQNSESGEPLPFATVVLYNTSDSTMAGNSLTEDDGSFSLKLPEGNYYAEFTYIGFEDKTVGNISVDGKSFDLGIIQMSVDAVALETVEVRAEKSSMEFKLDRRVFNVGKDLTNAGMTAADILDNVPSVTVDVEGNVSLRGGQGVRILVDGKPSALLNAGDTEALQRMQGDMIEKVEVITNPSARYEAEGEAGIINIILKKDDAKGINGSFGAKVGNPANYGASYNLNYRQKDLNLFSTFGLDYRRSPGGGSSIDRFLENGEVTSSFETDYDQSRGGLGGNIQLGADWFIDEKNTLTGSILYSKGEDRNDAEVIFRDFDEDGNLINTTTRLTDETEKENEVEASLLYERLYDVKDKKWTIDFKYILDDETELADYQEFSDNDPESAIQRSSNTEDEQNILLQTDYIHPFSENSRFEVGARAAFRTINNDFSVEEQDDDGVFKPLPDFNDQLQFQENIYAAYAIGATEVGDWDFQLGLRGELSDIEARLVESGETSDQYYFSLFPSASIAYSLTERTQFQVSYSRRISRPRFRYLLPFSNFNNPRNNPVGNPNLRPEFGDSYELGMLRYMENGSFLATVYYRHTSGVIERIILPGPEEGTTIRYPINLATRDAYGLELNFTYDFFDWWNFTSDVNIYHSVVDGDFEGQSYDAEIFTMNGRINSRWDIGDKFMVQASYDYRAPQNNTQGRRKSISAFDIAIAWELLNGRGTLTLSVDDVFNTRIRRSIVDLPDYQRESDFQWRRAQQVTLNFSYRLNERKISNS
jgi:outer membrane receptor protein involved in Fe transport